MGETLGLWAGSISLSLLIGSFLGLAVIEALRPARETRLRLRVRWSSNIGLQAINTVLISFLAPAALIEMAGSMPWRPAFWAEPYVGDAAILVVGVLALDLYAYGIHRVQHAVFPLWRFHAVHHSDTELDATTGFRHHPLETVLVTLCGLLVFVLLGFPWWVYPVYSALAIVAAIMQHANTTLHPGLDRVLQTVFVTPSLHDVHHSTDKRDYDSNFATVFSFWDRLFGTYKPAPALGADRVAFGIEPFTDQKYAAPIWALLLPLKIKR